MAAVDFVLLFLSWAHVLISPYTKVEESFNLHATHDVFFYGVAKASLKKVRLLSTIGQTPLRTATDIHISKYDHFVFPGVVPRTFVGSVLLAWTTKVLSAPLIWLGLLNSKFDIQIMRMDSFYLLRYPYNLSTVRLILASANTFAFSRVRRAISHRFGYATGTMFGLITCTQFHLPFWMGRTLPNMFALVPCNIAFARLISNQADVTVPVSLLVLAAVVFRAELAVYVGILSLYLLLRTRTSLTKLVAVGLISGFTSLAITVSVDSYFWQKWPLWPEWQGIYFNVVEGKSSEWGVSPVYAYWALHLPKLLLGTFPFSLVGFTVDPRIRAVAIPPIIFVCILSLLGHKEWRFVVYVVPVFNLAAANAFVWCSQRLPWTRVVRFALLTTLVANAAVAGLLTMISNANYPGGDALTQANKMSRANGMHPLLSFPFIEIFVSYYAYLQSCGPNRCITFLTRTFSSVSSRQYAFYREPVDLRQDRR
ncbi:dolichyl-P-Man:Man(7)GlcNAc(2)-PP-dolichol alpha-1,6-mannosyltransferase [Serendipita sp. 401]|nr:dolichyl-P-Man:Man(7)GlcNAc(2)-PP-dolichol alpha-1,6-mannosyltransferase [Serendipita sp. 401]